MSLWQGYRPIVLLTEYITQNKLLNRRKPNYFKQAFISSCISKIEDCVDRDNFRVYAKSLKKEMVVALI